MDKLKTDSTELEKIIASKVNNLRAIEDGKLNAILSILSGNTNTLL